VRAVAPDAMGAIGRFTHERGRPLHVHVSEQPAENAACLEATGLTPTGLLAEHGVLGPRTTAVHAIHVDDADRSLLGESGTTVCLCPTTERSLADGVGPAAAVAASGSPICLGSDSHAIIDLFEEARAVELNERLVTGTRGHHAPERLLEALTSAGMASLGWEAGRLAPGQRADLVAIDRTAPRLAGARPEDLVAHAVFAATAADVTDVVCDGRVVVEEGRHVQVGDVGRALDEAIEAVLL
jgi:formiminoglutamate deiminase